jgi:sortase A
MNKRRLSQAKIAIFNHISLGLVVVGFGLICFSLFNIMSLRSVGSTQLLETERPLETPVSEKALYSVSPAEGDVIGSLSIPALELELPIIQGTGTEDLKKGVGHFVQSVLPGEGDNCVLSGHRDTVFAKLGKLKTGDQLTIKSTAGSFTYEVSGVRIVDKDDKTVIVPTDHAVLTLTTCYPFSYVGPAPDRYIITANLIT